MPWEHIMETYSSFEVRKGLSVEAIFTWVLSVSKELICEVEISKTFNRGESNFHFLSFLSVNTYSATKVALNLDKK